MSFPHPAVTAARRAMTAALASVPDGGAVLLAVSGGSDSMAMTKVAMWAARGRIEVLSATVDHGLRPESGAEALAVDRYLRRVLDTSIVTRIDVLASGGEGPEGNARNARYDRLADIARAGGRLKGTGPLTVFLGHTADDQAETVLMGLGRGSGPRSIAGMRQRAALPGHDDVPMVRPYLHMRRADLRVVCSQLDIPWLDDPSNHIDGPWRAADGSPLRRSEIRHRALPALDTALGGGVTDALARTATMIRDDDDLLTSLAAHVRKQVTSPDGVVVKELARQPRALRARVLREILAEVGDRAGDIVYRHIDALDRLVCGADNNRELDLPGAHASRRADLLTIKRAEKS
ncbi:tRNA lysidine(34) synthetase TilS [Trueperella pyogenes]|uniref:tRNA lysidine(34) synthetase TilS n=1 Tax=Trueperella pyogenes TaxID=1661 RepID=UPI002168482C|nr:tRNA lysidine(34) synthetase TilS [Trueperella pyogenes]UVJ56122.1 tRNA lysidine(34) synthetase TilS [Trueperella pyogenes]